MKKTERWFVTGIPMVSIIVLLLGYSFAMAQEYRGSRINFRLGGYGSAQYLSFSNNSILLKRFILYPELQVGSRLGFLAEVEFENEPYETVERGREDDTFNGVQVDEVELYQAHLNFYLTPQIEFQVGTVLVPFSKFNLEHEDTRWSPIDRPLMGLYVVPSGWGEPGVKIKGESEIGEEGLLKYEVAITNGLNTMIHEQEFGEMEIGLRKGRADSSGDNNDNKAISGRFTFSPFQFIDLGVSGYHGKYDGKVEAYSYNDQDKLYIRGYAGDVDLGWKNFRLVGEYARFDIERNDALIIGIADFEEVEGEPAHTIPKSIRGYYLLWTYSFFPAFLKGSVLGRGFDHPKFDLWARYEQLDIEKVLPKGVRGSSPADWDVVRALNLEDFQWIRTSIGITYYPTELFSYKLGYQWSDNNKGTVKVAGKELADFDGVIGAVSFGW